MASGRYRRTGPIALITFFLVVHGDRLSRPRPGPPARGETSAGRSRSARTARRCDPSDSDPDAYQAEFAWIPLLIVLGLIGAAVAALTIASRRRRHALGEDDAAVAEQLADVLDETLDDLRAEPDPRRAVIAAYARLERSFAVAGLPRRAQETAVEYVPRALDGLEVDPEAVRDAHRPLHDGEVLAPSRRRRR